MGAPALGITTRNTRSIEHRRMIGPSFFAPFIGPCALGFAGAVTVRLTATSRNL
jgi:hypothetical protein